MIYRVALQRSTVHEAAIQLEARSEEEALSLAEQRARDGMVAWTEVHSETDVFSESEMKAAAQ